MRVAVLTTSYPRDADDHVGRFVADAVDRLRAAGVDMTVLAPGSFRDFGLAYGDGVMANVRRRPWAGPLLFGAMAEAARRAARDADLVHAHWLPAGAAALGCGKPVVVTLHGTDVELARRAPRLARMVLRRTAAVICVSRSIAEEARRLGAPRIAVIPNGVELPDPDGTAEASPPEILYAGRLSEEKGIEELAEATTGMNLVVVGDGPLRHLLPAARGWVSREELERLYRRAAIVVCPSRREGFGLVCAEAMAYGKPVVATSVGGFLDLVVHGETGLLVPPRDSGALRSALEKLLLQQGRRQQLGDAGRARIAERCGWKSVTQRTLRVYEEAVP